MYSLVLINFYTDKIAHLKNKNWLFISVWITFYIGKNTNLYLNIDQILTNTSINPREIKSYLKSLNIETRNFSGKYKITF